MLGRERHRDPTLEIRVEGGEAETSDLGVSGLETWLLIFHRLSPPADKEPLAEFWSSFVFLFNLHLT